MKRVLLMLFLAAAVPTLLFAGGAQEAPASESEQGVAEQTPDALDATDFDSKWRDPQMPQSWFSEPEKASVVGITSFNESPMLAERVASGELPPVEDRLPDDPPVIEPYAGVGEYGGELVMYGIELSREFDFYAGGGEGLVQPSPDGQGYYPWFVDDVEFLENDTVIRLTFREGLKWSDGEPFVAGDEYTFHWNHALNKEVADPTVAVPAMNDVVRIDDNTVELHLGEPSPTQWLSLANVWFHEPLSDVQPLAPAHIMRQKLPEFIGEADARRNAEELGFNDVDQYIIELAGQVYDQDDPRLNAPTMQAYVAKSRTENELVLERNPFYPFVDTAGNQLPYIDRIVVRFAAQRENVELQVLTGNADVLMSSAIPSNIPIYLQNEEQGNYTTYINLDAALTKPVYAFNFTPPPEAAAYAPYYQNVDFRRAMSLAINRDQVNDRFYYGRGIPGQLTIAPMSDLFKPEYAEAYAEYDPERARGLLDDIGLRDLDGDGMRDFPDGSDFRVRMMYANISYLSEITLHEYVVSNWNDVGIAVDIQTVDEGVFWDRSAGLQWELKPHLIDISVPYPMGLVILALAPVIPPEVASFGDWATYFLSDGESGQRPPQEFFNEIETLFHAGTDWMNTLDDEPLVAMLESQAQNVWSIGTVGFTPVPALVSNRIRNVPERVLWDGALKRERLMFPAQWWIDE